MESLTFELWFYDLTFAFCFFTVRHTLLAVCCFYYTSNRPNVRRNHHFSTKNVHDSPLAIRGLRIVAFILYRISYGTAKAVPLEILHRGVRS